MQLSLQAAKMADDMDDDNELLMVTGRSSKAAKKRQRKADSDDERDEPAAAGGASKRGKQGAGDSGDDEMNEDTRKKLESMNELEREMYLYEREEQLQRARLGKSVLDQTREQVGKGSAECHAGAGTACAPQACRMPAWHHAAGALDTHACASSRCKPCWLQPHSS